MFMALERNCSLAVLIACLLRGAAFRQTATLSTSEGKSLEETVLGWQAALTESACNLAADAAQGTKDDLARTLANLDRVWASQEKPASVGGAAAALDAIAADFTQGAETFARGVKGDNAVLITTGVLHMAQSVLKNIAGLANWIPVVGHVMSVVSSVFDFVVTVTSGSDHPGGTTSITSVMRRVVQYELDQNHVSNLEEEYYSTCHEIQRIHEIFVAVKVKDDVEAAAVLDVSNFKALTSKLNDFVGKLMYQIETRLKRSDHEHLPTLFHMYWQSMVHYSLIQQRAVAFITGSITPETDLSEIQFKYFVYVTNFQAQRDSATRFFKFNWKLLDDLSNTLFVSEPGNPVSSLHLQLKPKGEHEGNPDLQPFFIGMTPSDDGYPSAAMSATPAPLEIQWVDDSKWMSKKTVHEGEWVSIVNPWTNAERRDRTVLYFSACCDFAKYESPGEAGDGGTEQREQKAWLRFERADRSPLLGSGRPLRDGDEVYVWNKHYPDQVLCGALWTDWKRRPSEYKQNYYYLKKGTAKDCARKVWIIRIGKPGDRGSGNDALMKLASTWKELKQSFADGDDDL